jgi:hypothetical protein
MPPLADHFVVDGKLAVLDSHHQLLLLKMTKPVSNL